MVLAQQELYTETTLTALIPALTRRDLATVWRTLRVWAIVLAANLAGTLVFAFVGARTGIFTPEAGAALAQLSAQTMAHPFLHTATSGAAAGWLIGLMVWLPPPAGPARPLIIIILTYAVAVFQLPHVIVGSVEAAYGMFTGAVGVGDYLGRFLLPTLIGNTLGGTALVALLNHAPIAGELQQPVRRGGRAPA